MQAIMIICLPYYFDIRLVENQEKNYEILRPWIIQKYLRKAKGFILK